MASASLAGRVQHSELREAAQDPVEPGRPDREGPPKEATAAGTQEAETQL